MEEKLYFYKVLSYRIIDADSIEVILDVGFNASLKMVCRLYGVDVAEKNLRAGQLVTEYVSQRFMAAKNIYCQSIKKDKFAGRFLGIIYLDGKPLNEELLEKGYCISYFGESKTGLWTDDLLKNIENKFD